MGPTALDDVQKLLRLHRNVPQNLPHLPPLLLRKGPRRRHIGRRLRDRRLGQDDKAPVPDLHPKTLTRRPAQRLKERPGQDQPVAVADADDPSGHGHERPPCYDICYNIGRRTPNGQGVERREEEGRTGTRRPGRPGPEPQGLQKVHGFTSSQGSRVHNRSGTSPTRSADPRSEGSTPPKNPLFWGLFSMPHDDLDPREG